LLRPDFREAIMPTPERSSPEWYAEAARCYIEGHQGCAWCGGAHSVYRLHRGNRVEYYCNGCDFSVVHDLDKHSFSHVPGEKLARKKPPTMCQF
jgi:hypothetical protein